MAYLELITFPVLSGECERRRHFNPGLFAPRQEFSQLLASVRVPLTKDGQGELCARLTGGSLQQNSDTQLRETRY